jgi:hypothetical protein
VIGVGALVVAGVGAWLWFSGPGAAVVEPAGVASAAAVVPPVDSAPAPLPPVPAAAVVVTEDPRATTQPYATLVPGAGSEDLAALRASEAFAVFAEWDRAVTVEFSQLAAGNFAPQEHDQVLFEWDNVEDLWNSIAPVIRDDALLAGPEWTQPLWEDLQLLAGQVGTPWNNETTEGRGDVVRFQAVFNGGGFAVLRSYVVLIATDEVDGRHIGYVHARMPAFDLREQDFADGDAMDQVLFARIWDWVSAQPAAARR